MFHHRYWIIMTVVIFGLAMFIPVAQGGETYDFTVCLSGKYTTASASKELTVISYESRGICRSNPEKKVFDNCSWHAVGATRFFEGKRTAIEYTRLQDLDGDYVVIESNWANREATSKFLEGTGKWKGIKGEGKAERTLTSKPIDESSWQSCSRFTGTFELPK